MEAKICQFSSSDDLVITSHNPVICKRFKNKSLHCEEYIVMGWGTQKTSHPCFSSTHMPVLKGIHGSSDETCLPSSPCLHKWERGEADNEKNFTWKGGLVLT